MKAIEKTMASVAYKIMQKQRAKDKQAVIKAINKRIKIAKKIIEINNMKLESCKDKDLEIEIIANLNIINDYEIFSVAIDKIYGGK